MAKQNWLPRKEADRRTAVNNLADKLPGAYATQYGLTTGELITLENFRLWFNWTFTVLENVRLKAQGYTGFRDDLAYGTSVASGSPAVTLTPVANGFGFVATLVARIKGHAAYAVSDGNDLGRHCLPHPSRSRWERGKGSPVSAKGGAQIHKPARSISPEAGGGRRGRLPLP